MRVLERQISILFVGSAEELSKMGGFKCAFPKLELGLERTGFLVGDNKGDAARRCVILVLDNGDPNIPSTIKTIIQDNEKEISDVLIVLSSFGDINRHSEHDFYKRWRCFNLYSELEITDTSDSVIERELYLDEKSHMWKIFVRFTRHYGKERDRINNLSIISSMMKKYSR